MFFIFRGKFLGGDAGIEKKDKQGVDTSKETETSLAKQEKKLIELIRGLDYGELHITVKGGLPVHAEEIKKSIKL